MESTLYKIINVGKHSGIFYGPYTLVYGFGVLSSILIHEFFLKKIKFKNKILKLHCYFLTFTIVLSLIELIGGNILNLVFKIDMWDYSNHRYHFGKYICLTNSLIWGVLGTLNIYFLYLKLTSFLKKVPSLYTYILLIIFLVDFIVTIVTKIP